MKNRKVVTIIKAQGKPDGVRVEKQGIGPVPEEKPAMKFTPDQVDTSSSKEKKDRGYKKVKKGLK